MQDVARLDVAVHDAGAVRRVERVADVGRDRDGLRDRQRPAGGEHVVQRPALHRLHDEVRRALVDSGVVRRHDARVRQSGRVQRLAGEALAEHRVRGVLLAEDLDGDVAVEHTVGRQPHDGHPAGAEHLAQLVPAPEHPPLARGGRRHGGIVRGRRHLRLPPWWRAAHGAAGADARADSLDPTRTRTSRRPAEPCSYSRERVRGRSGSRRHDVRRGSPEREEPDAHPAALLAREPDEHGRREPGVRLGVGREDG